MPFAATCMDAENIILSKVNQTEKGIYYMISLICRILKIIQMNLYIKQEQNHRRRKQTHGYQSGEQGREGIIRNMGLMDKNYYT